MKRILYSCKKCRWETSILEAWGDLKPRVCGNPKCRQGFLKDPSWLIIKRPESAVVAPVAISSPIPTIDTQIEENAPEA